MTVGELRKALEGADDSLEIVVRTENDEGDCFCGTAANATVEREHDVHGNRDGIAYFAIDCMPDEEE